MSEHITITSVGGVEVELELVALGGRSFGFIIDWHIRFIVALIYWVVGSYFYTGGFNFTIDSGLMKAGGTGYYFLVLIPAIAIYFLYHPLLEMVMNGRTPGKRMAGIRIVASDGRAASHGAIMLRNVFRLIDTMPVFYVLGCIVCLVNRQHLRIGDIAAGTVLVYEDQASRDRVEMIMSAGADNRLTTSQRELIAELLDRWRDLKADTRRSMAVKLLEKFNPDMLVDDASEEEVHNKLHKLLQ